MSTRLHLVLDKECRVSDAALHDLEKSVNIIVHTLRDDLEMLGTDKLFARPEFGGNVIAMESNRATQKIRSVLGRSPMISPTTVHGDTFWPGDRYQSAADTFVGAGGASPQETLPLRHSRDNDRGMGRAEDDMDTGSDIVTDDEHHDKKQKLGVEYDDENSPDGGNHPPSETLDGTVVDGVNAPPAPSAGADRTASGERERGRWAGGGAAGAAMGLEGMGAYRIDCDSHKEQVPKRGGSGMDVEGATLRYDGTSPENSSAIEINAGSVTARDGRHSVSGLSRVKTDVGSGADNSRSTADDGETTTDEEGPAVDNNWPKSDHHESAAVRGGRALGNRGSAIEDDESTPKDNVLIARKQGYRANEALPRPTNIGPNAGDDSPQQESTALSTDAGTSMKHGGQAGTFETYSATSCYEDVDYITEDEETIDGDDDDAAETTDDFNGETPVPAYLTSTLVDENSTSNNRHDPNRDNQLLSNLAGRHDIGDTIAVNDRKLSVGHSASGCANDAGAGSPIPKQMEQGASSKLMATEVRSTESSAQASDRFCQAIPDDGITSAGQLEITIRSFGRSVRENLAFRETSEGIGVSPSVRELGHSGRRPSQCGAREIRRTLPGAVTSPVPSSRNSAARTSKPAAGIVGQNRIPNPSRRTPNNNTKCGKSVRSSGINRQHEQKAPPNHDEHNSGELTRRSRGTTASTPSAIPDAATNPQYTTTRTISSMRDSLPATSPHDMGASPSRGRRPCRIDASNSQDTASSSAAQDDEGLSALSSYVHPRLDLVPQPPVRAAAKAAMAGITLAAAGALVAGLSRERERMRRSQQRRRRGAAPVAGVDRVDRHLLSAGGGETRKQRSPSLPPRVPVPAPPSPHAIRTPTETHTRHLCSEDNFRPASTSTTKSTGDRQGQRDGTRQQMAVGGSGEDRVGRSHSEPVQSQSPGAAVAQRLAQVHVADHFLIRNARLQEMVRALDPRFFTFVPPLECEAEKCVLWNVEHCHRGPGCDCGRNREVYKIPSEYQRMIQHQQSHNARDAKPGIGKRVLVNFDDGVWYKGTINARARTTRRDAEAGDVGEPIQGRYKNIRVDTANDVNETPPTAWSVLFDDCTRGTFIQGDKEVVVSGQQPPADVTLELESFFRAHGNGKELLIQDPKLRAIAIAAIEARESVADRDS